MAQLSYIFLAARGDDDWVKFVIGGIAVAIWLLGSLAQAMSKKKEPPTSAPDYRTPEEIERAQREEIQRRIQDLTGIQIPVPPPQPARVPPPQAKVPPQRKPVLPRKVKQKQKHPAPPPIEVQEEVILTPAPPLPAAQPVAQAIRKPSLTANAATLNRWLNPATLRQQYILTELLQKPVALRPDHLNDV